MHLMAESADVKKPVKGLERVEYKLSSIFISWSG